MISCCLVSDEIDSDCIPTYGRCIGHHARKTMGQVNPRTNKYTTGRQWLPKITENRQQGLLCMLTVRPPRRLSGGVEGKRSVSDMQGKSLESVVVPVR